MMDLTLPLERDGAFAGRPAIRHFTLDALCELFGVIPHDRHTAGGDAFITAQVFLRLLRLATRFLRPIRLVGGVTAPFLHALGGRAPGSRCWRTSGLVVRTRCTRLWYHKGSNSL